MGVFALLLIVAVAWALWHFFLRDQTQPTPSSTAPADTPPPFSLNRHDAITEQKRREAAEFLQQKQDRERQKEEDAQRATQEREAEGMSRYEAMVRGKQAEEEARLWNSGPGIEKLGMILWARLGGAITVTGLQASNGEGEEAISHADVIEAVLEGNEGAVSAIEKLLVTAITFPPLPVNIEQYQLAGEVTLNAASKTAIVDRPFPTIEDMPQFKEYRYVNSTGQWKGTALPDRERRALYNNVVYQFALRTVADCFAMPNLDSILESVVVNGFVDSVDRSTGQPIQPCILSLMVSRKDFLSLNLDEVDPEACFKKLRGIAAADIANRAPIAPILSFDKNDRRFIESREVLEDVSTGTNIAAISWQDFEHLIRGLFEQEFCGPGCDVKVTRASRDAGVDAVIFDPDPIRGGKIVVQAKRYTNTVELSAVRDLYGTVVNEGAIKGILITTSDYGSDAYEFAKDKPLTLLNGGQLLYLLEKHGHQARIDLKEAKRLASAL